MLFVAATGGRTIQARNGFERQCILAKRTPDHEFLCALLDGGITPGITMMGSPVFPPDKISLFWSSPLLGRQRASAILKLLATPAWEPLNAGRFIFLTMFFHSLAWLVILLP